MDNELDARLRRLEAGQADQGKHLMRVTDELEHIRRTLSDLVRLMTQPDEDATKLHAVLASLAQAIGDNTATLQELERSLGRKR